MVQYLTPQGLQGIAQAESGNQNIYSNLRPINPSTGEPYPVTSLGSGYFQIIPSTWRAYAPNVPGASQYSSAIDAPYDVQAAVASYIPASAWSSAADEAVKAQSGSLTDTPGGSGINFSGTTQGSQNTASSGGMTFSAPSSFNSSGSGTSGSASAATSGNTAASGSGNAASGLLGIISGLTGGASAATTPTGYSAKPQTTVPAAITAAGNAIANQVGGSTSGFISGLESWLGNGMVMIAAVVIGGIGLYMLMREKRKAA